MGKKLSESEIKHVCNQYIDGIPTTALARQYNVSATAINGLLQRRDIERRSRSEAARRCELNENAFNAITSESAYWIGFLMADGSISYRKEGSPQISLVLAEKDKKHIEKFRDFLGSTHSIIAVTNMVNGTQYNSFRLSIRSTQLVDDLSKYGVLPKKSLSAKVNILESNENFWRGVIDGDGSIGLYKAGPMLRLIGSLPLMQQWLTFIETCTSGCNVTVRRHKSIYQVSLCYRYAIQMLNILYCNAPIALERKSKIAQKIIRQFARFL